MAIEVITARLEKIQNDAHDKMLDVMNRALRDAFLRAKRNVDNLEILFGNGTFRVGVNGEHWMPQTLTYDEAPPKGLAELVDLCELALNFELYDVDDLR